jgi:putative FmdB family regulatory protein
VLYLDGADLTALPLSARGIHLEDVLAGAGSYVLPARRLVANGLDAWARGDHVVTQDTATGTHNGELMGIPPTRRLAEVHGRTVAEIRNGRVVRSYVYWDTCFVNLESRLGERTAPHEGRKRGKNEGVAMPRYEFVCEKCKKPFELILTISEREKGEVKCPKCKGSVVQQLGGFMAQTSKKS